MSLVTRASWLLFLTFALFSCLILACEKTVSSTVLVLARDTSSSYSATSGLDAHGIPYEVVVVPKSGLANLPTLAATTSSGNYGGIIIMSEVSYGYDDGWYSALTASQWQKMFEYQVAFAVRMVRLDVYPLAEFGTETAIAGAGCCSTGVEQLVSFSNTTAFPTAGLKKNAGVSTQGLWHYPAKIIDTSLATEVAQFAAAGDFTTNTTAAVINKIGSREQMVWFTSWGTEWSQTSNYLMHAHIHWMTRGLFIGRKRLYLSTQVDDVQLATSLYSPAGTKFRTRTSDMETHATWQADLTSRMPAGSSYVIELGHNGNGNIEWAANNAANNNSKVCGTGMVQYEFPADTALEFQKPLGTGKDLWSISTYNWTAACLEADTLAAWFMIPTNRNHFFHVSHTFTHLSLNNATYNDTDKEIRFNQKWFQQSMIENGNFSAEGLIPPAITGLHNGDAIKAFLDNGIKYVVGDNSRPVLKNTEHEYWALTSTVANNGYAGLTIIPRWSSPIYYNCDLADCTLQEWINTSGGSGDFSNLLQYSKTVATRALLGLHHDGFMFHQANMRSGDSGSYTVGPVSGQLSLLQIWTETVAQEMTRLTDWPIISLKHDDLAKTFVDRQARDECNPSLTYTLSEDNKAITGAVLRTATGNNCTVPIPVTMPVAAQPDTMGSATKEQIGSDPMTIWMQMTGVQRLLNFTTPMPL